MALYLFILLLLQKTGGGHCDVILVQPPAVAAMLGSSINLSCLMETNGVKLDRTNLYWITRDAKNMKKYLYPRQHITPRTSNSRLLYPNFSNDLSVTIDNVQLPYTDTYICETSLLIGLQHKQTAGNGTYLLVYEEFTIFMNLSDIVCKAKVQAYKNVDLFWESQDQELITSSVLQTSDNSYWIISVLTNTTQWCRTDQKTILTCNLRYRQQNLAERSTEITCAGDPQAFHSRKQPILLYVSLLGNSLLILIIIIVGFFWMKKKRNRRSQIMEPYVPLTRNYKG